MYFFKYSNDNDRHVPYRFGATLFEEHVSVLLYGHK